MKNVSNLAVCSMLTLLTACGGGGTPVSTLPGITDSGFKFSNISSMKTSVDNKEEIVAYVEGLGIDLSEDISSSSSGNNNRAATSKRRNSTNNSRNNSRDTIESKYNIAQKKYARAQELLKKNIDEIRKETEEVIADFLKFFGLWNNEDQTGKDILETMNQDDIKNIDKDTVANVANAMKLKEIELDKVKFYATDVYSETAEQSFNFEKDSPNGVYNKLRWTRDNAVSHLGERKADGSYYFGKKQYSYYYYYKDNSHDASLSADFEEGETPTLDKIKEKLKADIDNPNHNIDSSLKEGIRQAIEALTEDNLVEESESNENDKFTYELTGPLSLDYKLIGKDLDLTYSDYGYMHVVGDESGEKGLLYGGYDDKLISKNDLKKIENLTFKGKAIGQMEYIKGIGNEQIMNLDGEATLTLNNGTSMLDVNFKNWYDIKVIDDVDNLNGTHTMTFSHGHRMTDKNFKFAKDAFEVDRSGSRDTNMGIYKRVGQGSDEKAVVSDIKYYGDAGKPIEAVGQIGYAEGNVHSGPDVEERRFEMVFGVKKQ